MQCDAIFISHEYLNMLKGRSKKEFEGIMICCQVDVMDSRGAISFQDSLGVTPFESATSRMVQRQQRSVGEPSEREHYSLYC